MTVQIQPEWISALACLGGFFCVLSYRKINKMQRSSIVLMFKIGMILIGLALGVFGLLYLFFLDGNTPSGIVHLLVRLILFYLFSVIDLWLGILLIWGKNL